MSEPVQPAGRPVVRYVGVGCLMAMSGWFSGAIVAVLISQIVGFFLKIPNCDQMPVPCNWYKYAGAGAVIGAITLPALVLNRIRQSARDAERAAQQ